MNQQADVEPIDPAIYDKVLASIDPKANEADMEIVMKEYAEELKSALEADLDHGFLIWAKQPPRARYQAYVASTLPADVPHALNPDFIKERTKLREATGDKKLLALMAETFMDQRTEWQEGAMVAASQGVDPKMIPPMPPHLENVPVFWPLIAQLPDYMWARISRDFKRQLNWAERRTP